ncbi:MAG: NAD(P)-binding protein, partial [Muribaculaceae bacterium]|nr:NAD(P)-binding protein [Muribaculaceae bacterium]
MEDIETGRNAAWREELRTSLSAKERAAIPRAKMTQLDPEYRIHNSEEVNRGLNADEAILEASRCLDCPTPTCVEGCPVGIDIPGFIKNVQRGDVKAAEAVLGRTSALTAVCGRVCPPERQCDSRCIYNIMNKEPVAIGYLERFAADMARENNLLPEDEISEPNGIKVAVVGSGPAGLSFAGDMSRRGFEVHVFEALHEIGGVLKYGIPAFRLPNAIVDAELENLRRRGVQF